jgi:hypothetical protein
MDTQKSKNAEPNVLYLAIKGVIADLNKEDQKKVFEIVNDFEYKIETNKDHAMIALSLIAAKYGYK